MSDTSGNNTGGATAVTGTSGTSDGDGGNSGKAGRCYDDEVWKHVTVKQLAGKDGRYDPNPAVCCNYCGKTFKGGASRTKAHLSGSRNGITPCPKVPAVRSLALPAYGWVLCSSCNLHAGCEGSCNC